MRIVLLLTALSAATLTACGSTPAGGGAATAPAPAGTPCADGVAAPVDTNQRCVTLTQFPNCFMCVQMPNDAGVSSVCEAACRLGMSDCPSGQTCVKPNGYIASGCDAVGTQGSLGYCQ